MASHRRTNAEFVEYLEGCCRDGAVTGDVHFHMSADDSVRWQRIQGKGWVNDKPPTRTRLMVCVTILNEIAVWRKKVADKVARKLTTGSSS